ncbi:MAG: nucleotidyltransferase domain-containing protein [Patescibacteria group bacterium]|nr:nucleotidyltransferase domain-containing protein [Patescibacteria group bacterium]
MNTQSSNQSLQEIINTLSKNDNIDALLLCGSTATEKQTKSSDYDLVLVVKEKPEKLLSLFTYINDLPADIFFFTLSNIRDIISNKQVKEGCETWFLRWLSKGKISFDKSRYLSKLQNMISEIQYPPDISGDTAVYKINYNLVNNMRYFESNDPLYHSALEIRLLYSIVEALVGYFSMHHIYWEGEKKAIQYLEENDPEYLSIFQKATRASNLHDKFTTYLDLVEKSFTAEYPKWDKNVAVSIEGNFGSFWKKLLN